MPKKCFVNHTEHSGYQTELAIGSHFTDEETEIREVKKLPEVTQQVDSSAEI